MANKRKSSAKSVTAPFAYNPGKGRPKEYLAYLNYQEMQALKRLNGNNQERGPRGLPSFPPAGAMSGGSAKSPASTSKSAGAGSRPSSGGPRSGLGGSVSPSSGSPRGSNPPGGGGSNSGSRPSGGFPSSGGGNKGNTTSVNRSGPGSTGGYKTPGAGGSNADRAAINAAKKTNTVSAQKAPAFKADTGRTVNVGPMGTPVKVGAPASRPSIPKATVQSPMAGQGASFASPFDARIENFQRINDQRLKSGALGPEGVPSVSKIAAENARRLNAAKMAQQYSQYRSPPRGYPAAPQGVYGPRAGVGTSYLGTTDMPGMITTGVTSSYSPYSGTVNPRFNAAQTLMAYEAEKRVPGKIQDRVQPTERFRPPTRGIGDIPQSYPNTPPPGIPSGFKVEKSNISRGRFGEPVLREKEIVGKYPAAMLSEDPTMQGRATFVEPETGQFPAPTDKKQFYDRINVVPSPEQSLYTGKLGKTRGIGDVQLPRSQYSGYGAEGYSTLSGIPTPESSGLLPTQYPNYRPPSRSSYPNYRPPSESSAFDPSRLAAYDKNFGPELSASVGSDIEKALIGETSLAYPDSGPPGGVRSLEGFSPATQQNDLRRQGAETYTEPYEPGQSITVVSPSGERFVMTTEQFEKLDPADQERLTEYRNYPLTSMGTAPVVEMPQISLSPEQREIVEERVEKGQIALKGAGTGVSFISGVPGGRKLGGYLGEKYAESVKKKLDNYVLATPEQRAEMERKDPSLTAWAGIIGETPQLDRSNYTNWADRSGLRGPPDRRGGGENSGIAYLGTRPTGDETTTPTPDTPSTSSGRRPDIYYMWDLGINIPSPSDPNYNQYQTYLAERLAAQRAMGYV